MKFNSLLFIPNGLKIVYQNKEKNFIINDRDIWYKLIKKYHEAIKRYVTATYYMDNKLYDKAIWEWTVLIKYGMYAEEALINRACTYYYLQYFEQAEQDCRDFITKYPSSTLLNAEHYLIMSICFKLMGKFDLALDCINSAISMEPEEIGGFYFHRCMCNYDLNNFESAFEDLTYAIKLGYMNDEVLKYKTYLEEILNKRRS